MKLAPFLVDSPIYYPKDPPERFAVRLHFDSLYDLIDDARRFFRLYEFFQIRRPCDIWNYVWCEVVDLPRETISRLDSYFEEREYWRHQPPRSFYPFVNFDRALYVTPDDVGGAGCVWERTRSARYFPQLSSRCLDAVRTARQELEATDSPILAHIIPAIDRCDHPLDFPIRRRDRLTVPGYRSSAIPRRNREYYNKLTELISSQTIGSIAANGDDDILVDRIVFEEQRRRASERQAAPEAVLPVCLLSDGMDVFKEWDAYVICYEGGLGAADILIDYPCEGRLQRMVAHGRRYR